MGDVKVGDRGTWCRVGFTILCVDGANAWGRDDAGIYRSVYVRDFTPDPRPPTPDDRDG